MSTPKRLEMYCKNFMTVSLWKLYNIAKVARTSDSWNIIDILQIYRFKNTLYSCIIAILFRTRHSQYTNICIQFER